MNRWGRAARSLVRRPQLFGRLGLYAGNDDSAGVAWALRRLLSPASRHRLAATLLFDATVIMDFEAGGFRWLVPTGDEITAELLAHGEYSATAVRSLTRWVRAHPRTRGSLVIEVGANVGTSTLPLTREGWNVLAIEPVPTTFSFLETNVERNGLSDQVTCVQAAVAEHDGEVLMQVSRAHGASRVVDHGPGAIPVPARRLDGLLASCGVPETDVAFVWCDAEGSEAAVVASGMALWAAGVPLYAEIDSTTDAAAVQHVFSHFVVAHDEMPYTAVARPVGELAEHISRLERQDNVLLLPAG
ncbi:MAG: FkbM family methyltransferase [Acidimicrobiia bacterium]